jgi:hypothetical protein
MSERTHGRRRIGVVAAVAAVGLLAAGAVVGVVAGAGAATPTKLTVRETSFHIALPKRALTPGSYTLHVVNAAAIPHSLAISGPGIAKTQLAHVLAPGKSGTLTVKLRAGTYTIWCPVDHHAQHGMKLTVKVAGGGATTATTNATTTAKSTWG